MNKNKLIAIIVSIVVIAGIVVGIVLGAKNCNTQSTESDINMDIDLASKPKLKVLMPYSGYTIEEVNRDDNAKLIQTLTGYEVEYTQLPAVDSSKTLNTELMDQRPYNAMKLTKDQFSDLVKDDMLVDITDALEKFAPDMLANISEESWDVVKYDGRIYGIPERASSDNIENPIVVNYDLLLRNNLDMPTTLAEFEEVLRVMTNELGKPALTFDQYTPLVYAISAAFGIYADWQEYDVGGEKKVLHYMNAPRYKDYVDFMNSLYSKGYIDKEAATNKASNSTTKFTQSFVPDADNDKSNNPAQAGMYACSLWTVPSIVTGLQAQGVISATEAEGELDEYLGYIRALKENATDDEKVYRSSGFTYIVGIPYYMAENAGYALDWMNSKIKDTDEAPNFRSIVLGEEGKHFSYSPNEGYLPIKENFAEKDNASYYLTGSNENKYTEYWKARVRKQPELFRAWSALMENADAVGVYNVADFTPPIEDYNSNRSKIEEYAQSQFFVMMKDGSGKIEEYLTKLNNVQGGKKATDAINEWYKTYKK